MQIEGVIEEFVSNYQIQCIIFKYGNFKTTNVRRGFK